MSGSYKDWEALIEADPDDAAKKAAKTLDDDPESPLALFVIATVYQRAERFGISANIYQRITQLKPERAEPWNNLGMCWAGLGRNIQARNAFHEAWKREKSGMFAANIGIIVQVGVDANGQPLIEITSADFGPFPAPEGLKNAITAMVKEAYTGSLGPVATGLRIDSISIADGIMSITGRIR